MLACGDVASATHGGTHDGLPSGHPSCVVHDDRDTQGRRTGCTPITTPDLTGRIARCHDYGRGPWTGRSWEGLMGGADKSMSTCGRQGCLCQAPSSPRLAFFTYRGPGSAYAAEQCGAPADRRTRAEPRLLTEVLCAFTIQAHRGGESYERNVREGRYTPSWPSLVHDFVSRGPTEFDRFYCGCRGWD